MIHTLNFYIELEEYEVQEIRDRYSIRISEIDSIAKKISKAFTMNIITSCYFPRAFIVVDIIKLLGKRDITERDQPQVLERIRDFLFHFFSDSKMLERHVLIRNDYCFDIVVEDEDECELLFYLYKKSLETYRFQIKIDEIYETTIYFYSKSVSAIVYNKEIEALQKGRKVVPHEENVIRFEVRVKNSHINYQKNKNNKPKKIPEYFKEDLYFYYMQQYFRGFMPLGNYYKIYHAKKIINSSSYSKTIKQKLLIFIKDISGRGMQYVKDNYSYYQYSKFLQILESLHVNPILIPKNEKRFPSYLKNPFIVTL